MWAVATPTLDVFIEDLEDNDAVALGGPRGGVPKVLQKEQVFRFQPGVLATQRASLLALGEDDSRQVATSS